MGITELANQGIAITTAPQNSAYLLTLNLDSDQYLLSDVTIETAQTVANANTLWQIISQNSQQLSLLITATEENTLVITPEVHSNQASTSSDSRCFVASALYAEEPEKLTKLRAFRDQTLRTLPGGDWMITQYYHYSPQWVEWSKEYPRLTNGVRKTLDLFLD